MRRLRIGTTTIRLGAAGAVLAVLAVLTPAAAFAGSEDIAPSDAVTEQVQPTPPSPAAEPDQGEPEAEAPADESTAPGGDPAESAAPEPTADPPVTQAPETPAAQPSRPSPAQATTDPADAEPSVRLEQYERSGGGWQLSDGSVDFDNEIRYVLRVVVPASQALPAAQVRAHVPGWDTVGDHVTNVPARLVAGSAKCVGPVGCEIAANQNTGQVTWRLGDLTTGDQAVELTAEFIVRFGRLPLDAQFDASGTFVARAWCRGELSWSQPAARGDARSATAQTPVSAVYSNAVTATAVALEAIIGTPVSYPSAPGNTATASPGKSHHAAAPATGLPNTGGPQSALAIAGVALVVLGGVTVARSRRPRRR